MLHLKKNKQTKRKSSINQTLSSALKTNFYLAIVFYTFLCRFLLSLFFRTVPPTRISLGSLTILYTYFKTKPSTGACAHQKKDRRLSEKKSTRVVIWLYIGGIQSAYIGEIQVDLHGGGAQRGSSSRREFEGGIKIRRFDGRLSGSRCAPRRLSKISYIYVSLRACALRCSDFVLQESVCSIRTKSHV